jgi:hypothetical protein
VVFNVPEDQAADATAYLVQCMESSVGDVRIAVEANKPSPSWCDAS